MDEIEVDDLPAAEDIRPGALVERNGDELQNHSEDGGPASPMFAVEKRDWGMLADDTDIFANELSTVNNATHFAGDTALFAGFDKLHRVWGLLADGNTVEEDDLLVSNGDGTFRSIDSGGGETAENAIVRALEGVDTSGESDGPNRIRLEVMM
ncbi:hypothetical protein [Halalkalicoccus jeotgali]|nr:hypothetical protein [Halalkalicoccus jeotgali]